MAYTLSGRAIHRAAVVGSGNIGPDVALFLARGLARHGVSILVHDVRSEALVRGREQYLRKLRQGGDSGIFLPSEVEAIEKAVSFTLDRSLLVGSDLVVECATEDLEIKRSLFENLERIVPAQAILASNSSHFEPARIFERLRRPERGMVHHFFFPAERNPLVELVAGPSSRDVDWCARFYESLGKIPIRSKGRFGYAVNPVFEGLFLAALLIQKRGFSPAVVDAIACRALGSTAGPFAVLNMIGAAGAVREALAEYGSKIMPWFRPPEELDRHLAAGGPWTTFDRGATVSYSNVMYEEISRMLLGAYFGLALEVVESGVASVADLEIGISLGLALKPPFAMMNGLGPRKVGDLVADYARSNPGFKVPAAFGPWDIPVVLRDDRDGVAVLTLRRPRAMNAMDRDVFRQLDAHLTEIRSDAAISGAVITGAGLKAFCAGADLPTIAGLRTAEEALALAREAGRVFRRIETLGKPVVAALNGLSLGGGSELAYACTARISRRGVAGLFGQPEVKLGFTPAGGATQRLPRLIEFSTAWRLLRTGGSLSGEEALRLGLISEIVDGDLVDRAVSLAKSLPAAPPPRPVAPPSVLPEVDLGGLSRRIDEILRRAVLEGMTLPFEQALELEARCFAESFSTRDRRIGIDNYLRAGLKQPAPFVHA